MNYNVEYLEGHEPKTMTKRDLVNKFMRTFLFTYLNTAVALSITKVFCLFANFISI